MKFSFQINNKYIYFNVIGGKTILKKRNARILYTSINLIVLLGASYLFKKNIFSTDNNYYVEVLVSTVFVMTLFGIIHYFFMKLIFNKYDEKS